jgi:hypothetical protein
MVVVTGKRRNTERFGFLSNHQPPIMNRSNALYELNPEDLKAIAMGYNEALKAQADAEVTKATLELERQKSREREQLSREREADIRLKTAQAEQSKKKVPPPLGKLASEICVLRTSSILF